MTSLASRPDSGSARPSLTRTRGLEATTVIVAGLTVAVLLLRLSQMRQSLLGDELWSYRDIAGHSLAGVLRAVHPPAENAPPLFFLLGWGSAKLLGDPTVWIRLPSLIFGTMTVPVIYLLGRETVGRAEGVIGAAIAAASPFAIYYGIEARPYATSAFFAVASTFALVRAVRRSQARWWVAYVLLADAAAYTHYTAFFVLVAQVAWSFWICRDRLRSPFTATLAIVVLYLPWVPRVGSQQLGIIGALEPLSLQNILRDIGRLVAGYPYAPLRAIPSVAGLSLICAAALLGLFAFIRQARSGGWITADDGKANGVALIALLAIATPVGVLLYSLLSTDIWDARDLYASAPAAALLLGALLAALPVVIRAVATAVVIAALVFGTIRAISPAYARPPFRVAAHYLDDVASSSDPVIVYPSVLNLDQDIQPQLNRPHQVLYGSPARWPPSPHGSVFAVVEDGVPVAFPVRPPGLRLVARKHFAGLISFSVLTFAFSPRP